ncbi:hypothetical protein E2542_SST27778 [Spatholobus suberectus]|nr:hypothetical protein E2542_SST27778 [Spatholobus suberectus]
MHHRKVPPKLLYILSESSLLPHLEANISISSPQHNKLIPHLLLNPLAFGIGRISILQLSRAPITSASKTTTENSEFRSAYGSVVMDRREGGEEDLGLNRQLPWIGEKDRVRVLILAVMAERDTQFCFSVRERDSHC